MPKKKITPDLIEKFQIERQFHDKWAEKIKPRTVNYIGAFEAVTAVENRFALAQFGDIKGKKILDLGCGMGDASLYFAYRGAKVFAVDISPGMIRLVKRLSRERGYTKSIIAKEMVAEDLKFRSNFFDFVFGNGVLHHVEPHLALQEIHRVLKPGGVACFIDPLGHNPVINIYRKIADKVRTPTETPLRYSELENLTNAEFKKKLHKEFHLLTLLIFIWFYLFEKVSPNRERYWKKIIDDAPRIGIYFSLLYKIDDFILGTFPFLRKYCWNTVLVLKK